MQVEVCHALPTAATRIALEMKDGATVADALARSDIVALLSLEPATLALAIFGRRVVPSTPLHDGDRIEVLRPLVVDPMEARRRRAVKRAGGG